MPIGKLLGVLGLLLLVVSHSVNLVIFGAEYQAKCLGEEAWTRLQDDRATTTLADIDYDRDTDFRLQLRSYSF